MTTAPVPTYRAIHVTAGGDLALTDRPLLDPSAGHVRLRVEACGICATDAGAVRPHPDTETGVVPGHEVAGVIDAVGPDVTDWAVGQHVGVGFLAGHCGHCSACRHGDFVHCQNQTQTGIGVDGGYAEYLTARQNALVAIPDGLTSIEAAPLLCAGVTVYNAILRAHVRPGATVAIQGIGGLGHLGIQYAAKMGMNTVAIARGTDKEQLARDLGADHYIDATDPAAADALQALGGADALQALGGADLIVATASSGAASSALVPALATNGTLVVVGASGDPVTVPTGDLIGRGIQVLGSLTGRPAENEQNLAFALQEGVRPVVEQMPLDQAADAFARMQSGQARFRMVLVP